MENSLEYIMSKFIQRHYTVKRIKKDGRFKRALVLTWGEVFFLSENTSQLENKIISELSLIFGCDKQTSLKIINKHFSFKG